MNETKTEKNGHFNLYGCGSDGPFGGDPDPYIKIEGDCNCRCGCSCHNTKCIPTVKLNWKSKEYED